MVDRREPSIRGPLHSAIYEGTIRHCRIAPVRHEFQYRLFLMYLDLGEIDTVFAGRWFWTNEHPGLAQFRRRDHLGDPDVPLERAVRDLVASRGHRRPEGPIRLLTHLRYFGYVLNPVSFYFCFDRGGTCVEFIVAEVTNTPWGERHCYVLAPQASADCNGGTILRHRHPKKFHVSPFMEMDLEYLWRIDPPGNHLSIQIESSRGGQPFFHAELRLHRRELNTANLTRAMIRYPWMTARVAAAIYWQALRLRWKRVPFIPHPGQEVSREALVP